MEKIVEDLERDLDPLAPTVETAPTLTWADGRLLRDGAPTRILSGSLHYFRVHPAYWRDRLQRLVDLGLTCVDTYIPWNFHRPRETEPADFSDWRDIGTFLETATEVGLDVILRPGPYICAEWSNGGLPAWLTGRGVALRSSDPGFLDPVDEWFAELLPRLTPYQAERGGPVIAFQIENEFGSFGDDAEYVRWVAGRLRAHGVTEMLYTADGPTDVMLDGGSLPGVLAGVTLGSKPRAARALLASRRPAEPFVCAEFWGGWFDHWGQPHHVRDAGHAAQTLAEIVEDNGSVSIYMAHGGTNFGLGAGANHVDGELRATITSYDSDAPIAEDGRFTPKFHAMRAVLAPAATAPVSPDPVFLPARSVPMRGGATLGTALDAIAGARRGWFPAPPSFEKLELDAGLVRYSSDTILPDRDISMRFERIADRAIVFVDGRRIGTLTGSGTLTVRGHGRTARLTVIVENLGRVNYGPGLGEQKGLLGGVLVERRLVQQWHAEPIDLPIADASALAGTTPDARDPAGVAVASLQITVPADTHLALPGFGRGFVWINGFLLGRYWNIGPQQTLYVPAPLLRAGTNEVVVLELEHRGERLELREGPELGPEEQYVEEF